MLTKEKKMKSKRAIILLLIIILLIITVLIYSNISKYKDVIERYHIDKHKITENNVISLFGDTGKEYKKVEQAIIDTESAYLENRETNDLYKLCLVLDNISHAVDNKQIMIEYNKELFRRLEIEIDDYSKSKVEYLFMEYIELLWDFGDKDQAKKLLNESIFFYSNRMKIRRINYFMLKKELDYDDSKFFYSYLLDFSDATYSSLSVNDRYCLYDSIVEVLYVEEDTNAAEVIINLYGDIYIENLLKSNYEHEYFYPRINTVSISEVYPEYNSNESTFNEVYKLFEEKHYQDKKNESLFDLCWVLLFADPLNEYDDESIYYYRKLFESIGEDNIYKDNLLYVDFFMNYARALFEGDRKEEFYGLLNDFIDYDFSNDDKETIIFYLINIIMLSDNVKLEDREFLYSVIEQIQSNESINDREFLGWYARFLGLEDKAILLYEENRSELVSNLLDEYYQKVQ